MSESIVYGRALYYPYINFRSLKWLKTAALYYDGLDRIVPEDFAPGDPDTVKELIDKENFIRNVNPSHEVEMVDVVAKDFLNFAQTVLADEQKRTKLIKKIGVTIPPASGGFKIHSLKMADELREQLPKMGLAHRSEAKGDEDWFEFEPVTGALYMTCLSNHLASLKHLPVVTDDPLFLPLIRGVQLDQYKGSPDLGETLASLVIESVVPENINSIPIKKVIEFRRIHKAERHEFYHAVEKLVSDLKEVNDTTALKDMLADRKTTIENAVRNLKNSYAALNIATSTTMLGLSVPSAVRSFGPVITSLGVVAVALGKLVSARFDYSKSKNGSPYAYVLSLKKLKSETLAGQIFKGKIIF
jgi:hypothetical protein